MTPRFAVAWDRTIRLWVVVDGQLKRTRSSFTDRGGAEVYARILNREAGS